MKAGLTIAIAMLNLPGTGQAQAQPKIQERIAFPPAPGFVIGYQASNAQESIQEWVPKGETVNIWSRMLTIQRFIGARQRAQTPAGLLDWIASNILTACPGVKVSAVAPLSRFGREGATLLTRCGRNPGTGKPETTFFLAMIGTSDMHVAQVAFRSAPDAAGEAWARAWLDKVVLCGNAAGNAQPICAGK